MPENLEQRNNLFKYKSTFFLGVFLLIVIFFLTVNLKNKFIIDPVKNILANSEEWISFNRLDDQLIIEFDYLINNSCKIKEVRYGINNNIPSNLLVLAPCNVKTESIERFRTLPPSTSFMSIKIIFNDNSESNVEEYYVDIVI
tara:strand:+ start:83905 stop:84333 length:429 start_codon:yes stop_codon:yes gene_type:complete